MPKNKNKLIDNTHAEPKAKGIIADSIILKVGQGIMTIPRNIDKLKKPKNQPAKKETSTPAIKKHKTH